MLDLSASALSALNEADSRAWASVSVARRSCASARSCSRSDASADELTLELPGAGRVARQRAHPGTEREEHGAGAEDQSEQ